MKDLSFSKKNPFHLFGRTKNINIKQDENKDFKRINRLKRISWMVFNVSKSDGICPLLVAAEAERRSKLKELLLHDA